MHELYLGPFAEWRLLPTEIERISWSDDPFWGEIAEQLWLAWTRKLPPAMTLTGVTYHRYCFLPHHSLLPNALAEFRQNQNQGIVDLRDFDTQAELNRFKAEYAPVLKRVEQRLDRAPLLQWGIVGWEND
jgi:hypothetical protein